MSKGVCTLFLPHFGALAVTHAQSLVDEVIVHNGTIATSASMSLLERGLILGNTLHRTKALFPQARLVLRDLTLEDAFWNHILNQLYKLTPQIQPINDRGYIGRWIHAQGFIRTDFETLLCNLNAPAGYAANPTLSMLCATASPPGQLSIVHPDEEAHMLNNMSTRSLCCFGFHKSLINLLFNIGLDTLSKIRALTLRQLTAQFQKEGIRLYQLINPTERNDPIQSWAPAAIYIEHTIEWQIDFEHQLLELATQAIQTGLQQTPSCPRTISLAVRYRTGHYETVRHLKVPTRAIPLLADTALLLFHESNHQSDQMLGFTLGLGRLCPNLAVQADLFSRPEVERLTTLMDRRFPGKLCQPISVTRAFVPEDQYVLAPLHEP
jgi:hypothetical protein